MRKCLLFCFFIGWVVCSLQATQTDAARELICRVTHNVSFPVSLKISKQGNDTYYHYAVTDGVLSITASDNVSLCRGFYDYVKVTAGDFILGVAIICSCLYVCPSMIQ